ncbi:Rad3-related DNA helicase DinG (DinG) (PDB:5H8W) [Commensalibacter communis]|uniref:ATP-dependent DNA helicase n=1 Tax=Commensalibacter communis TaxID=2972786 RepID=UPI0022FF887C|nr:ATP-dependent DNA helicase [Commensalibacter communis]CAI3946630.1 Rad3-related DNA helicase DinG (DinG) (PDB:5H8W) [Commensalibacter communis]CAI3947946.1 Rad3-related DNA helicase DinG (DinG) (PDB:5H8W) [Commensalibacter communis]
MFLDKYSALTIHQHQCSLMTSEGELLDLSIEQAIEKIEKEPAVFVIHSPVTYRKLHTPKNINPHGWFDLLELAAFVYPTKSFGFTPQSMAQALDIPCPEPVSADFLFTIIDHLVQHLQDKQRHFPSESLKAQCAALFYAQWKWAPLIIDVLNITLPIPSSQLQPNDSLKIWRKLPKWQDTPPRSPPRQQPLQRKETLQRLSELLGPQAETRMGQIDFADISRAAFAPRNHPDCPNVVLAEAGTGTGKTLGYMAPATLWSEQNEGIVWINTYTKHLQRQIEDEFTRLYPDPEIRKKHVIVRKGRENYLCLLNLEEHLNTFSQQQSRNKVALILLCRWGEETNDGDLFGGDLPNWFNDLFNERLLYQLAERRGECIHGACPHYQCCFVENSIHKTQDANIVIANHALVMQHISWHDSNDSVEQSNFPTRFIFDEAHHLLDATDSAYSVAFSLLETSELRRWLLGNEGNKTRSKGLKKRIDDVIIGDSKLEHLLESILQATHSLPVLNWSSHFSTELDEHHIPDSNPTEYFFYLVYMQITARSQKNTSPVPVPEYYDQNECDLFPILPELKQQAATLSECFLQILTPLLQFIQTLEHKLKTDIDTLDKYSKDRIETTIGSLQRRAVNPLSVWIDLLNLLDQPDQKQQEPQTHVTFLKVEKTGTRILDIGIFNHWLDPTLPFMKTITNYAHGMILTSATLRDDSQHDTEVTWQAAEKRVGTPHLPFAPIRASLACPFNYAEQARVLIINDLNSLSINNLSHAFLNLFLASKGGALGLFTAIQRLKAVHQRIIQPLEEQNISLFAQHVDPINNNSLIELFKSEQNSCLLGTDAMRDGINIPGNSLRLVVFEKMPWPRPDILHRERRKYFYPENPNFYDEQLVRLRLRQAFGRLIRTQSDRGIFVILDRRTPTRMLSAFPSDVPIARISLQDAIASIRDFF